MNHTGVAGVQVTCNSAGRIVRMKFIPECPSPEQYPNALDDGTIQHFFPGASLRRFNIGDQLVPVPATLEQRLVDRGYSLAALDRDNPYNQHLGDPYAS